MHRAKVAKQEMKAEPKMVQTEQKMGNEVMEFDSVLDALYEKPGSAEGDAFRREALVYAEKNGL